MITADDFMKICLGLSALLGGLPGVINLRRSREAATKAALTAAVVQNVSDHVETIAMNMPDGGKNGGPSTTQIG